MWHDHTFRQKNEATKRAGEGRGGSKKLKKGMVVSNVRVSP